MGNSERRSWEHRMTLQQGDLFEQFQTILDKSKQLFDILIEKPLTSLLPDLFLQWLTKTLWATQRGGCGNTE